MNSSVIRILILHTLNMTLSILEAFLSRWCVATIGDEQANDRVRTTSGRCVLPLVCRCVGNSGEIIWTQANGRKLISRVPSVYKSLCLS